MTRKLHLLALALAGAAGLASVAHAQEAATHPSPPGVHGADASSHRDVWQRLAHNAAKEVLSSLGRFAKVTVAAPAGDSPFELALHQMLVSELNARDAFVVTGEPNVRRVEVKVELSPRRSTRTDSQALEHAAHKVVRNLGLDTGPRLPARQAMDVTVTTSVKDNGVYLARRTEMFQVRGADMAHYKQSAADLRVVGDQ